MELKIGKQQEQNQNHNLVYEYNNKTNQCYMG